MMQQHKRPCKKHGYRDDISAKLALAKVRRQDKPWREKLEVRTYKCPHCHKWHLTSQARYESNV